MSVCFVAVAAPFLLTRAAYQRSALGMFLLLSFHRRRARRAGPPLCLASAAGA